MGWTASAPYPDPEEGGRWSVVDVEPVRKLGRPVALAEMRGNARFEGFDLLRIPRLSVMPVPEAVWDEIMRLGS